MPISVAMLMLMKHIIENQLNERWDISIMKSISYKSIHPIGCTYANIFFIFIVASALCKARKDIGFILSMTSRYCFQEVVHSNTFGWYNSRVLHMQIPDHMKISRKLELCTM